MEPGDGGILTTLSARFDGFRKSDEERHALVEQVLHAYKALEARYHEKCNDFENELSSRRHWQKSCSVVKGDFDALQQQIESNPFALALIDGDGAIFHEHLLKQAADGGSEAGHLLMGEIKRHLQDTHGQGGNWSIMVQIYANFEGLSRKLAHVGILRSPAELQTFARAFSCNQALFSLIDVGYGKERADHKIREMFRVFVSNPQCKHIIFGGCHDNGYLTVLEPYKRDEAITSRVSLLETIPSERGFLNLGMNMTSFSSVFRSDPLPDARPLYERQPIGSFGSYGADGSAFNSQNTGTDNGYTNSTLSTLPTPPTARSAPAAQPQHAQQVPTPEHSPAPTPNPSAIGTRPENLQAPVAKVATVSPVSKSSKPSSYAAVGSFDATPKQISIAPEKPAPPRKAIYLNASDERIDITLPRPDPTAVTTLHQRIKQKKVCNNYHLLQNCYAGKECPYSHEPKLSPAQQLALKIKARERPCGQLVSCREFDCLSGHHCPRGADCANTYCTFDEDSHYLDRTMKLKYFADGEVELLK